MEAKDMSSAEIEKAMDISRSIGPWIAGFFSAVMYAVIGAILALIGAAIFKNERSAYDVVDSAVDPE
jgi:branched-subunit amino acid permease